MSALCPIASSAFLPYAYCEFLEDRINVRFNIPATWEEMTLIQNDIGNWGDRVDINANSGNGGVTSFDVMDIHATGMKVMNIIKDAYHSVKYKHLRPIIELIKQLDKSITYHEDNYPRQNWFATTKELRASRKIHQIELDDMRRHYEDIKLEFDNTISEKYIYNTKLGNVLDLEEEEDDEEEPKVEEPKVEEPKVEKPKVETQVYEEDGAVITFTITTVNGKTITSRTISYPKCVKCGSTHNNNRHWCMKCFNDWDKGRFQKSDKCLILDD